MVWAITDGETAESTKASGWINSCMVSVFTNGRMARFTLENTTTIRSMATESTHFKMRGHMKVGGAKANSME